MVNKNKVEARSSIIKIFTLKESVKKAIIRATFIGFLARVVGYAKNVAIAVILGLNEGTDAFFLAMGIIGIYLIFADVFDSIGVPNLVKAYQKDRKYFNKLSGVFLSFTTLLAFSVTSIALMLAPVIVNIAVGFGEKQRQLLELFYLILLPYVFSQFFFHHFGAINRSLKRYTVYFFSEFIFALLNAIFVIVGLILYKDVIILPIAVSIAQVLATIFIIILTINHIKYSLFVDKTIKRMLIQFFYLIGLYGVLHLFIFVDRAFASILPTKSVSALSYGLLVATIPRRVLKLENILITPLSEKNGTWIYVKTTVINICKYSIPAGTILFIFSSIMVDLLFGYGAFTNVDIELTAEATKYYALSLPFMFLWPVLYRVFQVKENLKPVFLVAIISVIINTIVNFIFVVKLSLGIVGICLGTFIAYASLTVGSLILLKRNQ